jgi:hypothetical protein
MVAETPYFHAPTAPALGKKCRSGSSTTKNKTKHTFFYRKIKASFYGFCNTYTIC